VCVRVYVCVCIQAVDCIFHVVRAFDDPDVTHVEDSVDPLRDLDIIAGMLTYADVC
jgi:obg-like ATPase 1